MEVNAGPEFDVASFDITVRFLPLKLPDKRPVLELFAHILKQTSHQ